MRMRMRMCDCEALLMMPYGDCGSVPVTLMDECCMNGCEEGWLSMKAGVRMYTYIMMAV